MLLINPIQHAGPALQAYGTATHQARTVRPRIDLQTGCLAGQSASWPGGTRPAAILAACCALATTSGTMVSIPAPGPPSTLVGIVRSTLAAGDCPPDRLELTFRAAMLDDAGVELLLALSALRDENVGLALENFGSGTIGLAARLPLSCVILAPDCIAGIPGSPIALAVLHTIVDLAHAQDMTVVATGIETERQRAILSGLGCDYGEGSLFGPAMPHGAASVPPT